MSERVSRVLRYSAFGIEFLLLFALQQTPGLWPEILHTTPVCLLPAVFCIAMAEDVWPATVCGFLGGLLIDFGSGTGIGFFAAMGMLLCCLTAYLCRNMIRANLLSCLLVTLTGTLVILVLHWLLFYVWSGYSFSLFALVYRVLPRWGYTAVLTVPLYYGNRLLCAAFPLRT